ncbi:hypothetical protein [Brumimicrobium salinarum]|nr:hypothetical protein [Brumimicrobium salinarum]
MGDQKAYEAAEVLKEIEKLD